MKGFTVRQFLDRFSCLYQSSESSVRNHFTAREFQEISVVEEKICAYQRGRVRYRGSHWYAMVQQDICILPGTRVLVVGRENSTLIVEPLSPLKRWRDKDPREEQLPHLQMI